MKNLFLLLPILLSSLLLKAQVGSLDPTFGINGIEKTPYTAKGTLVSDKGESFGIEVTTNAYNPSIRVYKYSSNGLPDLTFGTNGFTVSIEMKFFNAAVEDDGKIVVVGTVVLPNNVHDQTRVVRFNKDGSLFDQQTTSQPGTAYTFPGKLIRQDDKVILFGYVASVANNFSWDFVNSFSGSSTFNSTISPTRISNPYPVLFSYFSVNKSVAIQGNEVVVAGPEMDPATYPYPVTTTWYLSKYINGVADVSFGVNGKLPATLPPGSYNHMFLTTTGKIYIVDSILNATTGNNDFRIIRLNKNGSTDLTFNGTGTQITDFGSDDNSYLLTYQNDKIIVGGSTVNKISGKLEFAIARYNIDGTPDSTFSEDGKQTLGESGYDYKLEQIKVSDNRLLGSGTITSTNGQTSKITAAFLLKDNIVLACPSNVVQSNNKGICAATVNNIDPIITPLASNAPFSYTLSGATAATGTGTVSGKMFNKGETIVTYKLDNEPAKSCSFNVTVNDKEEPVITDFSVNKTSLGVPDHLMKEVEVRYNTSDNCTTTSSALTVSSSEAQSGLDIEDIANDWVIVDAHHVLLRAERSEKGNGRTYTITLTTTDLADNKTEKTATVTVPRDEPVKNHGVLTVRVLSNPSTTSFVLVTSSNSSDLITLKVVNAFGKIVDVKTGIPANGSFQIGNEYKRGIYFAELTQGNKVAVIMLIKM